jgi:hypothetical protein
MVACCHFYFRLQLSLIIIHITCISLSLRRTSAPIHLTSVLGVLGTQETSCILIAGLLERDIFDLYPPESPQEISKKYKRQSLGMPKVSPSSSTKISGYLLRHYIFIASYAMCCSWTVFILFSVFFCFVCCNKWLDPSIFVLERDTLHFHCLEHSSLHSYCSVSVHFLLVLHLALVFHSYFVQSLLVWFTFL